MPFDRATYDRHGVAVNASLDEAAFEAAWAEGQAMSQEQAIAEALRVAAVNSPRLKPRLAPTGLRQLRPFRRSL